MSLKSDLCSFAVIAAPYAISWWIRPRYNGAWLWFVTWRRLLAEKGKFLLFTNCRSVYHPTLKTCASCIFFYVLFIQIVVLIRPFEKTGRIMPWQSPSVRLSVRPSARPRFSDFSSTCFEISIWNLVYTCSRWHDMSSLSCITIGSFWPSLQPKVGQTHFFQSWPHKSRYILQIWYTGGLLYTFRHKFRFL